MMRRFGELIVYASRIPPRRLEAWRFGGLEAWKGSEAWSVEITPKGWQKGGPGHPKWSPGASKMEPGASKIGPGASKMAPNWSKIDQKDGLEALKLPKRVKQTPGHPKSTKRS